MSAADLVAKLAAAGTPPDLLAAVAQELFTAEAERRILGERRENERARKARSREVTGQDVTACDIPDAPPPPDKSPPDPQKLTPTPAPTGSTPRARKADPFPCPEGVDPKDWEGLIANRRAKRAGLSEGAHNSITAKLHRWAEDGWPPGPIVACAAELGWTTVFPTDEMKAQRNGRSAPLGRHQPANDGLSATTRAALDVFGPSIAGTIRDRADQVPRLGGPGGHGGGRSP